MGKRGILFFSLVRIINREKNIAKERKRGSEKVVETRGTGLFVNYLSISVYDERIYFSLNEVIRRLSYAKFKHVGMYRN